MASAVLSSLYHSGVGWFSDILEMEVFVDVSREITARCAIPCIAGAADAWPPPCSPSRPSFNDSD